MLEREEMRVKLSWTRGIVRRSSFSSNNGHSDSISVSSSSKAIGRGGFNIRLAGQLTGYEIDVYREGVEEDVELSEFSDEIEAWIIEEFRKVGLDTAKSVLEQEVADLVKRTDLEEETIVEVRNILSAEFSG